MYVHKGRTHIRTLEINEGLDSATTAHALVCSGWPSHVYVVACNTAYIPTYESMYVHVCQYMYVCLLVHMYICMYVRTCTYACISW